jgi:1A family penicillin-binding protein
MVARTGLLVAVLASWTAAALFIAFTLDITLTIPGRSALRHIGDMAEATTLLDRNDKPAFTIFKEQRIEVPLSAISPLVVKAIIAIEDQRFYDHRGVDAVRILGSALANLRAGRRAQGGSTLTQQLARQSLLTRDKTVRRKLKEVILAAELESEYSKNEILELYLNKVYFGDGLHGIEAASRGFFGKHASELTLGEAALLAGLVKSPSTWAPTVNLERAVARRAVVLQAMVEDGAITKAEADAALAEKVTLKDGLGRDDPHGAWFKEEVRRELVARFGLDRVYEGGLAVYTTVDPKMQADAERLVNDALDAIEARRKGRANRSSGDAAPDDPLQGALIAMDPATGDVRALVGGRDFARSPFDRAMQARRQPGSAFKPFVYATALEQGWLPASTVDRLDEPIATLQGDWMPEDEHADMPEMTLRTGLRMSSNRAAVRLLQDVGIDKTIAVASRLGLGSVPSVPSLALGSGEVTLEDLTAAYAAFADLGLYHTPTLIRRVEDRDGAVLFEAERRETQAVSPQTAFLLSSMLSDVVNSGTAWKARQVGFTLPAAGKTGTTNDYVDAWFVGYTPSLVAGVWVGFDQPQTILPGGYAGEVAVPLWARFMKAATRGDAPAWYPTPPGLVAVDVCRLSGKRPAAGCDHVEVVSDDGEVSERSMVYADYFPRGHVPLETCPLHPGDSLFDRLAGLFGHPRGRAAPVPAAEAVPALPPEAVTPPQPGADTAAKADPPAEKRGFWSRLFGRRDRKPDTPKPQ